MSRSTRHNTSLVYLQIPTCFYNSTQRADSFSFSISITQKQFKLILVSRCFGNCSDYQHHYSDCNFRFHGNFTRPQTHPYLLKTGRTYPNWHRAVCLFAKLETEYTSILAPGAAHYTILLNTVQWCIITPSKIDKLYFKINKMVFKTANVFDDFQV